MTGRHPVGVVLAGGASTRMGVDKATLIVGDKPMAIRVADAMWEAGCHPVESQGGDTAAMLGDSERAFTVPWVAFTFFVNQGL